MEKLQKYSKEQETKENRKQTENEKSAKRQQKAAIFSGFFYIFLHVDNAVSVLNL